MVGGSKSHTPFDSRLLLSLVKCEKEVADSFKSYTQTCENANNALNGWAAADTGDSPDVLTASNRVCELFDETFDAQRTYLIALTNYRSSLKDVAAREAEIRVILRDRDIFVSRLVKLNNKKPPTSDSAFEAHTAKLEEARAELAACESTLKAEERALVGVKRRIFREALRMRMRAMAQLADTWRDTAERAIDILDSLEPDNNPNGSMTDLRLRPQPPPPTQLAHTPSRHSNNRLDTFQSPEGSVIAPSHSASQVARRAAGIPADFSDDEGDTALGGVRDASSLHRSASMNDGNHMNGIGAGHNRRSSAGTNPPIAEVSHEEEMASGDGVPARSQPAVATAGAGKQQRRLPDGRIEEDEEEGGGSSEDERGHELDPKMYQVHVNKPLTPRELAQQKARQLMAQKQADERQMIQPQGQSQQHQPLQQQQQQAQPAQQDVTAPVARKRTASTPLQSPPLQQQQQQPGIPTRTTSPYRETPEDRQKRFSTLTTTTIPAYDAATSPINIPSAGTFTLDSYKKKNAPEATLFLPSTTGAKPYQATRAGVDSDDEAVDEVGVLGRDKSTRRRTASTPGRPVHGRTFSNESESVGSDFRGERRTLKTNRLPSGRDSAYYSRSDAGTSTIRGGEKRSKEKHRNEGHHKSSSGGGGFFGALGGLFKKRDLQSRSYGDDDDDDDSVLGSPKSRGTRHERNSSIWGGGSTKKKDRKSRIMEDSDSDAPDPRTLVKVHNNAGRARPLGGSALSDTGVDRQTEAAIRAAVNANTFSSIAPDRKKAMSDVGAPRATGTVKKKKTVASASTSPVSQATTLQPGTGTVKKKKKVASSTTGPAKTTVANNLAPATSGLPGTMMIVSSSSPTISRSNTMTLPSPAQRVTRETPSLMSVVAPPSQSSRIMDMPLPSAKNPAASATPRSASSPAGSALGVPDQPLKKKKTVKKSSTSSNVNGNLLVAPATASTLKASATTPNLLSPGLASTGTLKPAVKASSAVNAPRPASILSVGSGAGASGVARRKSVRLAEDTKLSEAKYENSGPPANIPRVASPQPVMNGSAHQGILKESTAAVQTNHNVHDYSDAGMTGGAGVGEWSSRPERDYDVSSDEGGDEYARIRHELSRSERGWKDAGFLDKGKGKARAY